MEERLLCSSLGPLSVLSRVLVPSREAGAARHADFCVVGANGPTHQVTLRVAARICCWTNAMEPAKDPVWATTRIRERAQESPERRGRLLRHWSLGATEARHWLYSGLMLRGALLEYVSKRPCTRPGRRPERGPRESEGALAVSRAASSKGAGPTLGQERGADRTARSPPGRATRNTVSPRAARPSWPRARALRDILSGTQRGNSHRAGVQRSQGAVS